MHFSYKRLILATIWGVPSLIYSFLFILSLIFRCKNICSGNSYYSLYERSTSLELLTLFTFGLPGFITTRFVTLLDERFALFETPITQGNIWPVVIGAIISVFISYIFISVTLNIYKKYIKKQKSKK